MEAAERFAAIVQGPDASVPLDEAALLISAATKPGVQGGGLRSDDGAVDVPRALAELDALAAHVRPPTLDGLRSLLFRDLGFEGNGDDYYDPANSWLDEVIERRVGIPITLAVVMLEVGRRAGVPLWGVSMPGHFLVRDKVDPDVFVDPFARGQVIDREGCAARFHAVQGPGSVFDDTFLEPVGKRQILLRMLANLEAVATMRSDRGLLQRVLGLRVALPEAGVVDHKKYAATLAAEGRILDAADLLDAYADRDAEGSVAARATADQLRARMN